MNAAAALLAAGKAKGYKDGIELAAQSIDSRNAMKKLNELEKFTNLNRK